MGAGGEQHSAHTLQGLQERLRLFATERDWEQFHTPKNLVLALVGELGELAEIFQWLSEHEASSAMTDLPRAEQIRSELADVLIYLLRLADVLDIDVVAAGFEKLRVNAERYPVELARGSAAKYDVLQPSEEELGD